MLLLGIDGRDVHLCVRSAFHEAIEGEASSNHISMHLGMIIPLGDRMS